MMKSTSFVTVMLLATTALAGERSIVGDATALMLATGTGDVTISIGETLRVDLTGDADDLLSVDVEQTPGSLRLSRPVAGQSFVGGDQVNIAIGDGAVSTVEIGGFKDVRRGTRAGPVDVSATVPVGTIIHLEGVTGEAVVGDTGADLVISCVGCTARLGQLAALRAELAGDGDIKADRIDRRLEASVTGNGNLRIGGGRIDMAEIAIVGDGAVDFAGASDQASVTIVGQGEARFQSLNQPAASMIVGQGRVRVGD